jgi:hypothetical protein
MVTTDAHRRLFPKDHELAQGFGSVGELTSGTRDSAMQHRPTMSPIFFPASWVNRFLSIG